MEVKIEFEGVKNYLVELENSFERSVRMVVSPDRICFADIFTRHPSIMAGISDMVTKLNQH